MVGVRGDKDVFAKLYTRDFVGHREKVHSVAWNCNGTRLGSGSVDQTVRVWFLEPSGQPSKQKDMELRGHTRSVDNLSWHPSNPDILASTSQDKSVRFWDTRSGKCENAVVLKDSNINLRYSPDALHVAVGNNDDELTILDVRKLKKIFSKKYPCELNEFGWTADGTRFLSTTGLGTVEVLAYPSMELVHEIQGHTSSVYALAFDPQERYFAIGSADAIVSLWDLTEMLCIRTFPNLGCPVRNLSFTYDGCYLACGSEDPYIDIADVETGKSAYQLSPTPPMNSLQWNPRHYLLAYAGDDEGPRHSPAGAVRVYGFDTPQYTNNTSSNYHRS